MEKNEKLKVAESQENIVQSENVLDNANTENNASNKKVENKAEQKPSANSNKKPLTPYQKYKLNKNQNGKKYFEFYDDIKVYTHNIWDW